jgi:hypothetical protein
MDVGADLGSEGLGEDEDVAGFGSDGSVDKMSN